MNSLFSGNRYQVFLSSTFRDLIEERQQVIQTSQRLACFPVAMEHFPASYEEQWTYIKPLIEKSDYFVCIIAGKYGHCSDDGKSFTQREFEYAVACNIPILVFYHGALDHLPTKHTEPNEEPRRKLQAFLQLAKSDRICKSWIKADELPSLVMQSLLDVSVNCPRPGWCYRGEKSKEFLELELQNANLQRRITEIETIARNAPAECFSHYDDAVGTVSRALTSAAEACARSEEILKIRILGICLHKSFPTLVQFIETTPLNIRIEIRLAIFDEESPIFAMLNTRWRALYAIFKQDLDELLGRLRKKSLNRNISIKLVRYVHMPNWHGILINYHDLFMGHCLWHDDDRFTAGQNPYDHYVAGTSAFHDRKIRQYISWFDFCRKRDGRPKEELLLFDTGMQQSDLDFSTQP